MNKGCNTNAFAADILSRLLLNSSSPQLRHKFGWVPKGLQGNLEIARAVFLQAFTSVSDAPNQQCQRASVDRILLLWDDEICSSLSIIWQHMQWVRFISNYTNVGNWIPVWLLHTHLQFSTKPLILMWSENITLYTEFNKCFIIWHMYNSHWVTTHASEKGSDSV